MRNITLADKAGFCFGVKRAVDTAIKCREKYNKPIFTLGQLIHNNDVVNFLERKAIYSIEIENLDRLNEGDIIIIRSHGVSPKTIDILKEKKLNIVDATCPYVEKIHDKVNKFFNINYTIVIVGDNTHPEVIGINGCCDDRAIISKDGSNLDDLISPICVVSQTTEKQENFDRVVSILKNRYKDVTTFNTICKATHIRQNSALKLSKEVDTMIIVGGYHSSNTRKLYEICRTNCSNTIHVENALQIKKESIKNSENIGVTAGASTPDWIIKEVIKKMNENIEQNEQLAFMDENDVQVAVGDTIVGEVISLNEKEVFVNLGYKKDGVLPLGEITKDENVNIKDMFSIGQEVEAKVISIKNSDGYIVLSKIEIERENAYTSLEEAYNNKEVISVYINDVVKGGIIGKYKGIRVFIPASHIELHHVDDLAIYIGKTFDVNIIELKIQRKGTKIVGSRRNILIKLNKELEDRAWDTLKKDDIVDGEVKRLTDFGGFVDINGIDGLLHVSEISWGRINKPMDVLKIGDKIKVCIIDIDKENKKLSLSMKKITENPWNNVEQKYPVGNIVLGKVVRFADFGAFVEIEPGVDGLVHISEISYKKINKPSDILEIGQEIKAKIINVSQEKKRISLSIKEAE